MSLYYGLVELSERKPAHTYIYGRFLGSMIFEYIKCGISTENPLVVIACDCCDRCDHCHHNFQQLPAYLTFLVSWNGPCDDCDIDINDCDIAMVAEIIMITITVISTGNHSCDPDHKNDRKQSK